jgi:hypothetical protein
MGSGSGVVLMAAARGATLQTRNAPIPYKISALRLRLSLQRRQNEALHDTKEFILITLGLLPEL